MKVKHETDFDLWLEKQVNLLRKRQFDALDIDHLIQEIEDLGNQRDTIERLWALTLQHMLKLKYQKDYQGSKKSWRGSIKSHSDKAAKKFRSNPCNKRYVDEMFSDAYDEARAEAAVETGMDMSDFPEKCEWDHHQIIDERFIQEFLQENG